MEKAEELLRIANSASDFASAAALSTEVTLGEDVFAVVGCKASDLSPKNKTRIMDILRDNMRQMYIEVGWGWKEVEKRKEVFDKMSRFITMSRKDAPLETLAFVEFRFMWNDDDEPEYPVLYCYELQVHAAAQKKGVGLILMRMLQQIAEHFGMRKVSLTVFKVNTGAMNFYKKAGFVVDADSPSQYGEDECYEILSDRNVVGSELGFTRC